jgi:hypothetical protein
LIRYSGTELADYEEAPKMGIWKVLRGWKIEDPKLGWGCGDPGGYRFSVKGWGRMDQTRRE